MIAPSADVQTGKPPRYWLEDRGWTRGDVRIACAAFKNRRQMVDAISRRLNVPPSWVSRLLKEMYKADELS